jgi:hypothetical protein
MTLGASVRWMGIALLMLIPATYTPAGAEPSLQIAQAGANETTPGGVEHQPTMEPDAAAPMAIPPPPAMPEAVAPPAPPVATEPVAPPAVAVPSETNAGSQEKKDETKPENPPN